MNLSPDDPKLTAFALGEITDPAEAQEIEAAVAASAELSKAVESIRAAGAALEQAFAQEPGPSLTEAEKAGLNPAAGMSRERSPSRRQILLWPLLAGVAAVVMIGFILAPSFTPVQESPEMVSLAEEEGRTPRGKIGVGKDNRPTLDGSLREQREEKIAEAIHGAVGDSDHSGPAGPAVTQQPAPPPATRVPQAYAFDSNFGVSSDVERESAEQASRRDRYGRQSRQLAVESEVQTRLWPERPAIHPRSEGWNTHAYDPIEETGFRSPVVAPVSTFSIDVDTASYAHVRGFLSGGNLPPPGAVRIEEFINYFPYGDEPPVKSLEEGGHPFAVHLEQAAAPWAPRHRLLRVNLKGYEVPWEERPASNLVFLMDVSGSMNQPNKLPLVKEALQLLVDRLDERDRVGIVVYAGSSAVALPSTTANNTETIRHAIRQLSAGGSTNANDGIQRAYRLAHEHFIEGGNNRVILCTDGDFNVGITDRGQLGEFVQEQADDGVALTVLGFGMGNYKDNMLEVLSEKGKGVYGYIDTAAEARKFFLHQLVSNLFTIAHDVKIQVEFNPVAVRAYRLLGYENRRLKAEEFNDDTKRAGDIGPGHSVTAFYEIVPSDVEVDLPKMDPLRYQASPAADAGEENGEVATVKLRYKRPSEESSQLMVEHVAGGEVPAFEKASEDLRFGAAVAAFGLRLQDSATIEGFEWKAIRRIARSAIGSDPEGHRVEFNQLVEQAEKLSGEE